ncbi:MAG: formylmethanofuran dehydrogenase subunit E family protein [Thaumarchaeota archaeon]|nr:formylmethanofuran dehydrogenase subunit E family protein [Nitrososphaerota archaeon]
MNSDELLEQAARFHGHLGPFLVLGLKAGLRAVEILGWKPLKMRATIILVRKIPYTCFLDGVQFATGCTLGKGNIKVLEGDGIRALFSLEGRGIELKVRDEVLRKAESAGSRMEEVAREFMAKKSEELFEEKLI